VVKKHNECNIFLTTTATKINMKANIFISDKHN